MAVYKRLAAAIFDLVRKMVTLRPVELAMPQNTVWDIYYSALCLRGQDVGYERAGK